MTPEAHAEMLARADRALRRGELQEALRLYGSLCSAFPADAALAQKLANVRDMLQPEELQALRPPARPPLKLPLGPSSPAGEGERLFALGDYAGAAAAYRRALQERPDSELLRERLEELYRLARAAPLPSPTEKPLPNEPEPLLHALLDRLAARRRLKRR